MSSTQPATGPMRKMLDEAIEQLKKLNDDLWAEFEIGINPVYTNYGVPEVCSQARAFEFMDSYTDDIARKKKQLQLLRDNGIEQAMAALLASVE